MPFEHKPGSGTLFKNDGKNPRAPIYSGRGTLPDGAPVKLAIWKSDKKDRDGNPWLSLKIEVLEDDQPTATVPAEDDDEEIPF